MILSGQGAARLIAVSIAVAKRIAATERRYGRSSPATRRPMPLAADFPSVGGLITHAPPEVRNACFSQRIRVRRPSPYGLATGSARPLPTSSLSCWPPTKDAGGASAIRPARRDLAPPAVTRGRGPRAAAPAPWRTGSPSAPPERPQLLWALGRA